MSNRLDVFPCSNMYFSSISENLSFCWSTTLRAQKTKKRSFNKTTSQKCVIIILAGFVNLPAKSSASCERQEAQNAPHVPAGFICSCVAFSSFRGLQLLGFVFAICRRRRFGPFITLFLRFLPLLHLCRHLSTLAPRLYRLHWKEVRTNRPPQKTNYQKFSRAIRNVATDHKKRFLHKLT